MTRAELAERLIGLRCRERVQARVLRLNPNGVPEGQMPRGMERGHDGYWHFAHWNGYVTRGRFIRRFGRAAWRALPNGYKAKSGRRQFVPRTVVEDRLWTSYLPGYVPPPIEPDPAANGRIGYAITRFPTRRYENDPRGCPVEREYVDAPPEVVSATLARYGHGAHNTTG